jgi:stage II sporulation protein D
MKQLGKDILVSAAVGVLLPAMILNYGARVRQQTLQERIPQERAEVIPIPVKILDEQGVVTEWEMDDYLVGVVLAEMPASFEPEALKAQSIVARTYARKAYTSGGKHGDGSVCTQPSCCQGYRSPEEYIQQGGREADLEKIRSAVLETSGQVLTFAGELIEATYFSCSGGSTEDAKAVWGTDYPYLQAVNSPGEEAAAHYQDSCSFTKTELEELLDISLTGLPESWVQSISYTRGGGVDAISIGGTFFTGVEIRQKLALKSTAFSVTATENGLEFTTRGYGHRVGMSQYGADAMAVAGSDCREILMHYYQGTEITLING